MRLLQTITVATMATLLLSNCTTQKAPLYQTVDKTGIVAKKTAISENDLKRWSHLDLLKDSIPGMSVDKAYELLLKDKKSTTVIVGVIDSGVDIVHEDLKANVWTNSKEIPGNGIDDDNNGYIDDIHGWNFLGQSTRENLEMTRIIKKGDDGSATYKRAVAAYDKKKSEAMSGKQQVDFIFNADKTISDHLNKKAYTLEDLQKLVTTDAAVGQAKQVMMSIITQAGPGYREDIEGYKDYIYSTLNYNLNVEFDGRKIVGDNVTDINDTKYGDNNVAGPDKKDALHGTHVAGIIAQVRGNNLGGDGVATNVKIMAIRAVPDGDEYDKDIALAIRYAADNGAKIINGSFGKSFSPNKEWVDDAIKYAAKKDVLFVHAAGNDGHNIDKAENQNYPNDATSGSGEFADNVITIGALNNLYTTDLVAPFSNFGAINVDVFAPGMEIYATVPFDKYKFEQGTSMAAPNVAGVAALIRSYYPSLTAKQVKQILMDSGVAIPMEVKFGDDAEMMPFAKGSRSGKIVNAYNALLMAEKMAK